MWRYPGVTAMPRAMLGGGGGSGKRLSCHGWMCCGVSHNANMRKVGFSKMTCMRQSAGATAVRKSSVSIGMGVVSGGVRRSSGGYPGVCVLGSARVARIYVGEGWGVLLSRGASSGDRWVRGVRAKLGPDWPGRPRSHCHCCLNAPSPMLPFGVLFV